MGTAVNIVAMIFGNTGDNSGSGVGFTRNPSTGERKLYAEFLINAQGEDVVSGSRTPFSVEDIEARFPISTINCGVSLPCLKSTTGTCRISSSP